MKVSSIFLSQRTLVCAGVAEKPESNFDCFNVAGVSSPPCAWLIGAS
jgi:hypothetical protein